MKLRELGEFGLIDRIAGRAAAGSGVRVGIGDDAAAVEFTPGFLTLVTADMLMEGVHFERALGDPYTLGRKSLAVNLSDIAAMGGRPRYALLSLALPEDLTLEFLDEFIKGLLDLAVEFGVSLIGGDTCASRSGIAISLTVMGEQLPARVVPRGGARPGDLIFITGTPGDSALGLKLLREGLRTGPAVMKHLDPPPRVREGLALAEAGIPSAMIDVSDGLLADLGHILDQSGVGARVELARIPLSGYFLEQRPLPTDDDLLLPLAGGEDYELLFTAPPAREAEARGLFSRFGTPLAVVGEITATRGLKVIASDGTDYRAAAKGYNHFP